SWYKARPFLATHCISLTPHAYYRTRWLGARELSFKGGQGDTRRPNPSRRLICPACPCDRCWKRVSISDTRPASGTRRWLLLSSANVTEFTSLTSRRRSPCIQRQLPSSRASLPTAV